MRTLHVINSLILAGVEVLLREMIPHMRQRGIDVTVAVLKTLDSPLENDLRAMGVPFLPIEREIYSARHVPNLARHIGHFDVVHSYLFPAQLWVALGAKLAGRRVPLVTTEQSTSNRRRQPWFRPLDRWMYAQYAAIACNSQATLDHLVKWVPAQRARTSRERFGRAIVHDHNLDRAHAFSRRQRRVDRPATTASPL